MSAPIRTIVAGVSHPAKEDPTLLAAAELARWTGARLHLVHAFDPPPAYSPPMLGHVSVDWAQRFAESQFAMLQAAARRTPGAEAAVCHNVAGAPGAAILDTAEAVGADLVVVGAARNGRVVRAFLGTTAQRVLRGATTPVLVVRCPLARPLERVLLTGDLSELSAAVHEEGMDVVTALFGYPGAARSLLVVGLPLEPSETPSPVDPLQAARAALGDFLRARRTRATLVLPVVRVGTPASAEIAAAAEECRAELVVVGTHARGWVARLALGSVAEATLRDAPCNVLAIPPRALALHAGRRDAAAWEQPAEDGAASVSA